jgi:hypothetical protein
MVGTIDKKGGKRSPKQLGCYTCAFPCQMSQTQANTSKEETSLKNMKLYSQAWECM